MNDADFLAACRALAPQLAAGAEEGERLRRVPDAVTAAVDDADVVRALVPTALGGHGVSLRALCDGTRALATGCPATAWTIAFLMLHGWMLSRFPAGAHGDLFGDGVPTAAAPLAPTGTLAGTDGGFVVSGRWEWATAIAHADWCIVHGFDQTVELGTRFAVLPVTEVTIDDVWHTSGMRATGSNTVVVDEVFVPAERTISGDDLRGATAGVAGDALAGIPLMPILALTSSACAVGAAEAAVDAHRARLGGRVLAYSLGERAADQPLAQARLAAVSSELHSTLAGWHAAIDAAAASRDPDDLTRVESRLAAAAAVRSSRSIIGAIGEGAGASVYGTIHPLQRLQRDVETLKGHVVFDWDRTTELAGRVMLGNPLRPTDLA